MRVAALDAGAAWYEPTAARLRGRVCGIFGRASYLRFGDRLLALCRTDVSPGPLHLRIPTWPALRLGDAAVFQPGRLHVGSLTITIHPGRGWAPEPVDPRDLARAGPAPSTPWGTGLDEILDGARDRVAGRDLACLARLVGGRGPGLTPAVDDLLAGVLVVDALRHPGPGAARQAVVRAVVTTDVAAAFLHWAARGQCIAPVHDVMSAIAAGRPDREAAAREALLATGASSGAALLFGLDLALSAPAGALVGA
jgi:Protein of unknown function (DUF2877)